MSTLNLGEPGMGGSRPGEMDLGRSFSGQPADVLCVTPVSRRLELMKGSSDLSRPRLLVSLMLTDLSLWRTLLGSLS